MRHGKGPGNLRRPNATAYRCYLSVLTGFSRHPPHKPRPIPVAWKSLVRSNEDAGRIPTTANARGARVRLRVRVANSSAGSPSDVMLNGELSRCSCSSSNSCARTAWRLDTARSSRRELPNKQRGWHRHPLCLLEQIGLEPTTSSVRGMRSPKLSYCPEYVSRAEARPP